VKFVGGDGTDAVTERMRAEKAGEFVLAEEWE